MENIINNNISDEKFLDNITSKKVIKKSIIWNIFGKFLPMGLALFTIPLIIKGLGNERFGLLTMIWMLVGYANIFDLGLGKALTQLISKKLGKKDTDNLPTLIWTGTFFLCCFGTLGSIILIFSAKFITISILKVSSQYITETIYSLYLLAGCIPVFFITSAFTGILNSYQKFATINLINAPLALFNYASPLLMFPFTHNLAFIIAMLLFGRIMIMIAYFIACAKKVDNFLKFGFKISYLKPLISFGGWITVSNIISPIMVSFDRFFISNILSASVVAFYTTPYEVISKILMIPSSIIAVMFPAFSTELSRDKQRAKRMYFKTFKLLLIILIIPVLSIIFFAKIGLSLWINPEFAEKSFRIAQILALGTFINGMSFIPFSLIQANGKSDITAKFHMLELPLYLITLIFCIKYFGIIGATIAWLIRVSVDMILLYSYVNLKIHKNLS